VTLPAAMRIAAPLTAFGCGSRMPAIEVAFRRSRI
jgi:hypothetical protein